MAAAAVVSDTAPSSRSSTALSSWTVPPPVPSTRARVLTVSTAAVLCSVPPSRVRLPLPSAASAATCSVPPLTTVLAWLLPVFVKASTPLPVLVSAPPDTSPSRRRVRAPPPPTSMLPAVCTTTARAVSKPAVALSVPPSSVSPPAPSTLSAPAASVAPLRTSVLSWLLLPDCSATTPPVTSTTWPALASPRSSRATCSVLFAPPASFSVPATSASGCALVSVPPPMLLLITAPSATVTRLAICAALVMSSVFPPSAMVPVPAAPLADSRSVPPLTVVPPV